MGQPKAHWTDDGGDWFATVGPYQLEARIEDGNGLWVVALRDDVDGDDEYLARVIVDGPCDLADLMRLAEAELARRLHGAAETMDGRELVGEQEEQPADSAAAPIAKHYCDSGACTGLSEQHSWTAHLTIGPTDAEAIARQVAPKGGLWVDPNTSRLMWPECERELEQAAPFPERLGGAAAEREMARKWAVPEDVANCLQPTGPDPYRRAADQFLRLHPPCSVCGRYPTPHHGEAWACIFAVYECGHTSDQQVRGSREWAIALMAEGNTMRDRRGRLWDWDEERKHWSGQDAGGVFGHTGYTAIDASYLPESGWDMPHF